MGKPIATVSISTKHSDMCALSDLVRLFPINYVIDEIRQDVTSFSEENEVMETTKHLLAVALEAAEAAEASVLRGRGLCTRRKRRLY